MAANAGPDIIEDGIVFYYDTGNTVKSFIGEPTENLFGTTAMAFQSDYPDFTPYIQNGSDSIGNYIIKDTVNAPWYTGLRVRDNGVRPLTTGVPYVVSFECQSPQHGWSWSLDSNQYGGDWDGNDSGRTSFTNLTFISTGGTTYTQDMVNTWQKVQYVVYMKSWSGGSPTAYPLDSFFPDANNIKIYYRNPQMEVSKTHATQYTPTSRSVTQGLLDMTRNSTVNLTDVSFNSTAQIIFDGTNDKIHGIETIHSYLSSSAIEFVVTPTVINRRMTVGGYRHNDGYSQPTIGMVYIQDDNTFNASVIAAAQVYRGVTSTTTVTANKTYHVVFNKNTTAGVIQMFVNGVLEATQTFDVATYAQWPTAGSYVGSNILDLGKSYNTSVGQGWGNDFLVGTIPVFKLYSKILTTSEVLTNYNALKTRFGI
jgi:hypothetical protein